MLSLPLLLIGFIGSFQTRINDCAQTRINNRAEDIIEGGFFFALNSGTDRPSVRTAGIACPFVLCEGWISRMGVGGGGDRSKCLNTASAIVENV